jgi:hypothetical protein
LGDAGWAVTLVPDPGDVLELLRTVTAALGVPEA